MRTATEILSQLTSAGVLKYVVTFDDYHGDDSAVRGYLDLAVLDELRADDRFAEGVFHLLHADVGEPRTEFRAHRSALGSKTSLQIVVNTDTGRFYADLDLWSPYSDVVGAVGHLFGEVIGPKVKRLFRRKGTAHG